MIKPNSGAQMSERRIYTCDVCGLEADRISGWKNISITMGTVDSISISGRSIYDPDPCAHVCRECSANIGNELNILHKIGDILRSMAHKGERGIHEDDYNRILADLAKHKEMLKVAVNALEFYADGAHIEVPNFKNHLTEDRVIDDGDVAREALAQIKELEWKE